MAIARINLFLITVNPLQRSNLLQSRKTATKFNFNFPFLKLRNLASVKRFTMWRFNFFKGKTQLTKPPLQLLVLNEMEGSLRFLLRFYHYFYQDIQPWCTVQKTTWENVYQQIQHQTQRYQQEFRGLKNANCINKIFFLCFISFWYNITNIWHSFCIWI